MGILAYHPEKVGSRLAEVKTASGSQKLLDQHLMVQTAVARTEKTERVTENCDASGRFLTPQQVISLDEVFK